MSGNRWALLLQGTKARCWSCRRCCTGSDRRRVHGTWSSTADCASSGSRTVLASTTYTREATTRNIQFYDKNLNDESETIIEYRFYDEYLRFIIDQWWWSFNPPYLWWNQASSCESVIEQHRFHHKKASRVCSCSFMAILFRTMTTRASSLNQLHICDKVFDL